MKILADIGRTGREQVISVDAGSDLDDALWSPDAGAPEIEVVVFKEDGPARRQGMLHPGTDRPSPCRRSGARKFIRNGNATEPQRPRIGNGIDPLMEPRGTTFSIKERAAVDAERVAGPAVIVPKASEFAWHVAETRSPLNAKHVLVPSDASQLASVCTPNTHLELGACQL